ncbi:acyl-CoA wax alcohol acyltransferase 2-like [Gracilinanus agilis]|uniref:acyl-CoA wax alcohol acyltransferase 2-like n=1 Tax=Gracilinanus agilis TaxID=191870 RepID=UPI001CFF5427|nr:acyl-CoA wax alcohol acyltransferase 2-like [Gracilinanus agilis]
MVSLSKKDLKTALEVFAVFQWALSAFIIVLSVIFFHLYLVVFTSYWLLTVFTIIWLVFDWKTPQRGGRRSQWIRSWRLWKQYRDYFPLKLVKTHELSPKHNYIIACHPHGLLAHSAFCHFATEASGFSKTFPGITPYMLTLGAFFWVPVLREYVMSSGACSVSQASMDYLLTGKGQGNAVVVVVGGLAECRYARPGLTKLVLKRRYGFVRMALQHGVALVPSYNFGENEVYDQYIFARRGWVHSFQVWFQRLVHIYPCAFYGRGFTQNSWGLLPYSRPITTIVGEPLPIPKIENPSQETVNKYHALYVKALRKLFDEHKTQYGISETQELEII